MYKNIEKQTKLQLKDQIDYQPGQVVSKTLVQNDKISMTIFSFDKNEEISTLDALYQIVVHKPYCESRLIQFLHGRYRYFLHPKNFYRFNTITRTFGIYM